MKTEYLYDKCIKLHFERHEILVLERYIKVLNNSEVVDLETLLDKLFEQQFNFIMDCMCEEATIKFDDLIPKFTTWQKVCKWLGNL